MDLRMHKAISIIQFKVEGQLITRQKNMRLESRALLDKIDYEKGTVMVDGKEYPLLDTNFPTIDPKDPYALSAAEEEVMERLERAFMAFSYTHLVFEECFRVFFHSFLLINALSTSRQGGTR